MSIPYDSVKVFDINYLLFSRLIEYIIVFTLLISQKNKLHSIPPLPLLLNTRNGEARIRRSFKIVRYLFKLKL